jgi:tetratricopeptide (TPR) repeat protein
MSIKPKTLRRLLLLGAFAGVIALGGTGFVLLRKYQTQRSTQRLRVEGLAAFDKGDYPAALDSLGRYIGRVGNDTEVLLRYARARLSREESDGRHLNEALAAFKRYLSLKPDDKAVLRETLEPYLQAGLLQEAVFYSQKLRPTSLDAATAADLPVLHIEAAAMLAMRPRDRNAPDVLARISALDPLNVEWQLRYAAVLREQRRTSDISSMVASVVAKAPGDPRATLIALLAPFDDAADIPGSDFFPKLCELAGLRPADASVASKVNFPDATYALCLADSFDRLGKFDHSLEILSLAAESLQSRELSAMLARRLYLVGRARDCIEFLSSTTAIADDDATMLGINALAFKQLGQDANAAAIRDALAARSSEFRARAWTTAIDAYQPHGSTNLLELERNLASACTLCPGEPIFPFLHAELLASMGRLDEAADQWHLSTRSLLSQGWALPWIRLSQNSLQTGDIRAAIEQSTMAVAQAPRAVHAAMARFSSLVALAVTSSVSRSEIADLIALADAISTAAERLPTPDLANQLREEVGVSRVLLYLRADQRDAATQSIRGLLSSTTPISRRAMERLALASALEELGLEEEIVAQIEKTFGRAPSTAAVRAVTLRLAGRKDEGFALLRAGAEGANAPDRLAWDIQIATFLDTANDPAAGPAWIALADANPNNMAAQRSALSSPSACKDSAFVERATQRFAKGTGASANQELLLRVASARARITPDMNTLTRDAVVADLRGVVADRPGFIDARVLLADVLLMNDPARGIQPDLMGAVTELRAAANASSNPQTRLRAAILLQEQRNFAEARTELLALWRERKGDATIGRKVAELLVAQGDTADAVPVVRDLVQGEGNQATPDLLVFSGSVLAAADAKSEAVRVLKSASDHPATRPDQWPEIAAHLFRLQQVPAFEAVLRHIDAVMPPARRSLLRARAFELVGNLTESLANFAQAVKEDANLFAAWSGLFDHHIRAGELDKAQEVLDQVAAALPNEPDLRLLRQRLLLASGTSGSDDLRALADLLAADPKRASEAQAVRAVEDLRKRQKLDDPNALESLALQHRGNLSIQMLAARRLMLLSPPRAEQAAAIASRAMTAFPADAEPARLSAQIFASQGRWPQVVAACRAWKEREPGSALEPDLAIAEAYLAVQRPDQAAAQLRPHVTNFQSSLDRRDSVRGLALYARAELAANKPDAVLNTLKPALATSTTIRNDVWLRLAANETPDEPTASTWIELARAASTESNVDDQVALASAWSSLGERFPDSPGGYSQKALAILEPLASSQPSAPVLELLGATLQRTGNTDRAIDAFRRAVAADPNRASALANLAQVFSRTGEHVEAVRLVDRALKIAGENDPSVGFLAASVLRRAGIALQDQSEGEVLLTRAATIAKQLALRDMGSLSSLAAWAQCAADVGDFPGTAQANTLILELPSIAPTVRQIAKNNLAYALARGSRSRSDLARAETLAREVHDARKDAGSLQTLALALAAQGRREEADRVIKDLLKSTSSTPSIQITQALVFAEGDDAQRQQARDIVRTLSTQATAALSPQDKRDLAHLRGQLLPSSHVPGVP